MGVADRVSGAWKALTRSGEWPTITFDDYAALLNFNNNVYLAGGLQQTLRGNAEELDGAFAGLVQQAYKANAIVFACMLTRLSIFSEARFQFRELRGGRPGDLFGNADLGPLEHPWPNGTTGDLLSRMLADADLSGNFFGVRRRSGIKRLRPDWVTIVLGSENDPDVEAGDIDAELLGYIYHPGGKQSGRDPVALLREEVAHFAPIPDPLATYRGMSWLTPIAREIMGDSAATSHKLRFFENGATPNMVVTLDKDIAKTAYDDWVKTFKDREPRGVDAYKTLYLGAGAVATVVGKDLQQLDFKVTQGAGESRIAAAAGVHPVIVGLSEGLQGSSLNSGNFQAARRLVADRTMRPLWRNAAGSLQTIIRTPAAAELWYDDRDIAFLREDRKDAAEIQQIKALSIRQLVDAGYEADSVVKAIEAEDMGLLKHSGLFSVQLQPPMPDGPPKVAPVSPTPQLPPGRGAEDMLAGLIAASESRVYRALERVNPQSPITFSDGAFRSDPQITVNFPEQPAPVVNVNIPERDATVTFEDGAIRVEAPDIAVNVPEQPTPEVRFEEGAIQVAAPEVTVEAAQITVEAPQITVEAPLVTVEPPEVIVNVPEQRPVTKRVERNKAGAITRIVEES